VTSTSNFRAVASRVSRSTKDTPGAYLSLSASISLKSAISVEFLCCSYTLEQDARNALDKKSNSLLPILIQQYHQSAIVQLAFQSVAHVEKVIRRKNNWTCTASDLRSGQIGMCALLHEYHAWACKCKLLENPPSTKTP
jgi:hypothetical protein